MEILRIIAVQSTSAFDFYETDAVIACAYKNNTLMVYDTFGELYYCKEYFTDITHLEGLVKFDKYKWTDFFINKGDKIYKDTFGNIIVNNEIIPDIDTIDEKNNNGISLITIKIYYEFLKTVNKDRPATLMELNKAYEIGKLKKDIEKIIEESPFTEFTQEDKRIIVRSRIHGYKFVINHVKKLLKSDSRYKFDEVHYFFSRLFKLEKNNYIKFNA